MPNFERIQDNLTSFNKSFGFYLQGLKIQSKTLDFPGIPTEDSTTLVGENTETLKPRSETGKPGMNSGSTLEESLGAYNADDTIHSPLHTVDSGDNSPQKAGVNERSINVSPRTIKNQSGAMGTKNRINDGMRDIGRGVAMGVEKNLPTPRRHATGIGPKVRSNLQQGIPRKSLNTQKPRASVAGLGNRAQSGLSASGTKPAFNPRKRKMAFNSRKSLNMLPLRYRTQPHKVIIEGILKELNQHTDGRYLEEIIRGISGGMSKGKCTEYMNILVESGVVYRVNERGMLYFLNETE